MLVATQSTVANWAEIRQEALGLPVGEVHLRSIHRRDLHQPGDIHTTALNYPASSPDQSARNLLAAKLIVTGTHRLATAAEIEQYKTEMAATKNRIAQEKITEKEQNVIMLTPDMLVKMGFAPMTNAPVVAVPEPVAPQVVVEVVTSDGIVMVETEPGPHERPGPITHENLYGVSAAPEPGPTKNSRK